MMDISELKFIGTVIVIIFLVFICGSHLRIDALEKRVEKIAQILDLMERAGRFR